MPMKLLSTDDFRAAAKDGQRPDGTVFRFSTTEPQQQGAEDARTMRFVFSDATVDHSDDSIDPKGWDTSLFKRNPVALFSHMSWEPPIGRSPYVAVEGDKLVGDIEFASADIYPFADTIYRLLKGKFMNAVSVGFLPKEWAFSADKNRPYGIDFKKQTLLEISVCPVPCNPNALGEARSLGVDTWPLVEWAEKVLDNGDTVFLPRKDLEALRTQAKGTAPTRYYLQAKGTISAEAAERARDGLKRWLQDPTEALVIDDRFVLRAAGDDAADWKCAAATDLPLDESGDSWDGPAAAASIFEHAGGADFDPAIARKGFLAYDASAPKLRGSYKLPFAHLHGDVLKADAGGLRAAASRLPDTDIPDGVKTSVRTVLDHYEARMSPAAKAALRAKAGRRISAATKETLVKALDLHQQAMDSHAAAAECIKSILADDEEMPPDEPAPSDSLPAEPEATVIPDDMTPEQRRLKEARELKASLPSND